MSYIVGKVFKNLTVRPARKKKFKMEDSRLELKQLYYNVWTK